LRGGSAEDGYASNGRDGDEDRGGEDHWRGGRVCRRLVWNFRSMLTGCNC